jgi:hypothetical protein
MKPTRLDEVRAWVQKAQNDLLSARILLEHKPPILDTAAFHCQQAVEKGLKAFLVWKEVPFEKVHSLPLTPLHFLDHSNPPASAACSSALRSSGGLACSTSCKASLREVLSSTPLKSGEASACMELDLIPLEDAHSEPHQLVHQEGVLLDGAIFW